MGRKEEIEIELAELNLKKDAVQSKINLSLPYWSRAKIQSVGDYTFWIVSYVLIFVFISLPPLLRDFTWGGLLGSLILTGYGGYFAIIIAWLIICGLLGDSLTNAIERKIGYKNPIIDPVLDSELRKIKDKIHGLKREQNILKYSSTPIAPQINLPISQAKFSPRAISTSPNLPSKINANSSLKKVEQKEVIEDKSLPTQTNKTIRTDTLSNYESPTTNNNIPREIKIINNLSEHFSASNVLFKKFKSRKVQDSAEDKIVKPIDYSANHAFKQDIGQSGELYVLEYERNELIKLGRKDLAEQVEHTSKVKGEQFGFDIKSYDNDGKVKYIEVKTSIGDLDSSFYLTDNEWRQTRDIENYYIYRVFNFDLQSGKGSIYKINCEVGLKYFTVEPSIYKVTPNRK